MSCNRGHPAGNGSWLVGVVGLQTKRFRRVTLGEADLAALTVLDSPSSFDGNGALLRSRVQAYSLGIAYEFDLHRTATRFEEILEAISLAANPEKVQTEIAELLQFAATNTIEGRGKRGEDAGRRGAVAGVGRGA